MPMPKDPEKRELARRRMSEARRGKEPWNKGKKGKQAAWNKGKKGVMPVPWNKGLTKETDERVRKCIEKMAKTKKQQYQDPEARKALSELAKKNWQNPEFRKQMEAMWADPDFRNAQSERATEQNKKNWADPEFCKKMSKIRKAMWKNPEFRKQWEQNRKEFREDPERWALWVQRQSKSHRGKVAWNKGKHTSEEVKRKMRENHKGFLGRKHGEKAKQKISETLKKCWQEKEFLRQRMEALRIKPNRKEKFLDSILKKILPNEYKFVGDFTFVLGGRCPDFMNVNGKKKLIELYGTYWHDPERFPKGDSPSQRIRHFRQFGFDTLIIWENELENKNSLIKKIRDFHQKELECLKSNLKS